MIIYVENKTKFILCNYIYIYIYMVNCIVLKSDILFLNH